MRSGWEAVVPAKAGTQRLLKTLDSRIRGNDRMVVEALQAILAGQQTRRDVLSEATTTTDANEFCAGLVLARFYSYQR